MINVFCDGGARGNPGPAAVGVYITDEKGKNITRIAKKIGVATNNVAEYKAVMEALIWLVENKNKIGVDNRVNFYLDSQLVVLQLNGIYKIKNPILRELVFSVREKENELPFKIQYFHIPREKNKNADSLVNSALDNI